MNDIIARFSGLEVLGGERAFGRVPDPRETGALDCVWSCPFSGVRHIRLAILVDEVGPRRGVGVGVTVELVGLYALVLWEILKVFKCNYHVD